MRTLMYSREAISSLFSPLATSSRTSSSRLLNAGNSGAGRSARLGEERVELGAEVVPGRLVGQEDVVARVERQHPRPRKQ